MWHGTSNTESSLGLREHDDKRGPARGAFSTAGEEEEEEDGHGVDDFLGGEEVKRFRERMRHRTPGSPSRMAPVRSAASMYTLPDERELSCMSDAERIEFFRRMKEEAKRELEEIRQREDRLWCVWRGLSSFLILPVRACVRVQ